MNSIRPLLLVVLAVGILPNAAVAEAPTSGASLLDPVLDAIVAKEDVLVKELQSFHPLVETYMQTLVPDDRLGFVPVGDDYFLGRLDLSGATASRTGGIVEGGERKLLDLFKEFYAHQFQPDGFARMLVLDPQSFGREHYDFEFVRREFLGEVRTLVFEVVPKDPSRPSRFTGRIWVEDRDHHIIRYNGIYSGKLDASLHFDSWRVRMGPSHWLPAYVYTEESEFRANGQMKSRYKGQTRIWGYRLDKRTGEEAFTKMFVEDTLAHDQTESDGDVSPVKSVRAWEREAEENVIRRLEKGGLLAPEGEVDEVLETVVANLEVTNELNIQPPVRCRVLLTTPLESFTVGHTIVLSRGLIDVLPDEASLAMALAHELGHILLGHQLDTSYAFSDQMLVGDKQAMERFFFKRRPAEEGEADEKAVLLLANSPYEDQLGNAGLFLKALASRSESLPALIRPHFGNRMAKKDKLFRMTRIVESAPELYPAALNQTAALPLGGRVKVDPWNARTELMRNTQIVLLSPREKMPFEVTPLMPHLTYGPDERLKSRETASVPGIVDPGAKTAVEPETEPIPRVP